VPSGRAGLGIFAVTSLVVGNVIGSSIFLLPSLLAPFGGLAIVSWVITSVGALLLALVFARLPRKFRNPVDPTPTHAWPSATSRDSSSRGGTASGCGPA
jgi:APA family basic amino acid/polyamine antiporter